MPVVLSYLAAFLFWDVCYRPKSSLSVRMHKSQDYSPETGLWEIASALSRSGDRAFLNGTRPCLGKWITTSAQSPSIKGKFAASMDGVPQAAPRSRARGGASAGS